MNIATLSYPELLDLKKQVEQRIHEIQGQEKTKAMQQIRELAKTYGLSVEEVLAKVSGTARKPVEAKYANPANPEQTWSGRGRKPVWVQEYLDSGKTLESLEITK
ncbi:H-NS histone family protein [Crenobacter sp. SG2303]|uniref:H-NS histone family protein n=1 Tax=Crenobacter oryzisoli TaxID=3056844 RepID=A0ABT7XMU8_9NEIS|nr:H-NS histone family protein [Crenobacter sp. SG2303]MDN0075117.1 H-NS histone family protein [Crenobacter sp. SG2303]